MSTLRFIWLMLQFAICLPIATSDAARAYADVRSLLPQDWTWQVDTQGPMCGVYSTCRALAVLGFDIEPNDLWNHRFVGSGQGSAPDELVAAIKEAGGVAAVQTNMSHAELLTAGTPVLANVRKTPFDKGYSHWVCVVNTEDGLKVFDGPSASRIVAAPEFLASWSGIGIVVSRGNSADLGVKLTRFTCIAVIIAIAYLTLQFRGWSEASPRTTGWLPITAATVICAIVGSYLFGVGKGHREGVDLAIAPYRPFHVDQATLADAVDAGKSEDCLLVDARMIEDFAFGSLPNAVNIPVTATHQDIKEFLNDVPRDVKIVVYCQSATCAYDEHVAQMIAQLNFQRVSVADEGYAEFARLNLADDGDSPNASL